MTHEEILAPLERHFDIFVIRFEREYAELRNTLVEKYGEEPMARKDAQLLREWEERVDKANEIGR